MIILDHNYVVDVDRYGYTVMLDKQKQDKEGKPIYEIMGYYETLASAVNGAKECYLRKQLGSDTHTLDKAIELIRQTNKEFLNLLERVMQDER